MRIKASLHIHTNEDKRDGHMINYNVYQLIDNAKSKGFNVLGYTPHQNYVFKKKYKQYALKQGILLIPGIELNMGRFSHMHLVVLNCNKSIEKVKNFKQLIRYKATHPKIFILAPHPTYNRVISMGKRNLKKYISLFDAIEYSWFYSEIFNSNRQAEAIAAQFNKPMISTSDVHNLKYLDSDFLMLDTDEELSANAVFRAIKNFEYENITAPKKITYLIKYFLTFELKNFFGIAKKNLIRVKADD